MKSRNPVMPIDRYFPDGEPHLSNGELYVYPSCDLIPDDYCSDRLFVPHSRDLSHWEIDGPVFDASKLDWPIKVNPPVGLNEAKSYDTLPQYMKDTLPKWVKYLVPFALFKKHKIEQAMKAGANVKRLLYAPDALTVNGKSMLFFCTSDGGEGVAFSDSPKGPFTNPVRITYNRSGEPIEGIDPAIFRDDDGKCYLYWGQIHSLGAELSEDMTKVKEDTVVRGLLTEEEHAFHEGSSMRKINGRYYYIFADSHRGKPTAIGYAVSDSPLGPFTYQGIIVDNDGCDPETWNNHGSIECIDGQWYVFYHRSTGNSRYLRRMCAEPITIDEDGKIHEVLPSSTGMGDPYRIGETMYAYEACQVKNAYIDYDRLIVKKGVSEVVYRYLDAKESDISEVICDGGKDAKITYKLAENGELRIRIESGSDLEIRSFTVK